MSRIVLSGLEFYYDSPYVEVFRDLTLSIETDWRTGLVGRNGRGKTTLLRLIRGELIPARGTVAAPPETAFFPYDPPTLDAPTLEVLREAIAPFRYWEQRMDQLAGQEDAKAVSEYADLLEQYQRYDGYDIDNRIARETADIGLAPEMLERPFATLSGGERTRALIAALFLKPEGFPLIDEPTNHLDLEGRDRLAQYLSRQPGFILVSHDRHLLARCVDHIVSVNLSDVRVHGCGFTEWKAAMDREELTERRRDANLTREIRSLRAGARQRRTWSDAKEKQKIGAGDKGFIGHRAAKQMKRALSIERRSREAIAEKEKLLRNVEKPRRLVLRAAAGRTPGALLRVQDLSVDIGGRPILRDVSLALGRGERVAVMGPNGCGKTTLLRAVAGELEPSAGIIALPNHMEVQWSFQHPLWREGSLRARLEEAGLDERRFRSVMGSFGVCGEVFDRPLETFSRGERKKVDLCRSFVSPAHLLVWDEPMNYIDLVTRGEIEVAILEQQPTMLFVEHDRWFVEQVATDVVEL